MNRQECLDFQYAGKEVYYNGEWWKVSSLTYPQVEKPRAYLVQVNERGGIMATVGWIDADLVYPNPCELCDLPADGLDQVHCQVHWEQVCEDGYMKQLAVMYGARVEDQ